MGSSPALAFILLTLATLSLTCDGGEVLVYSMDGSHWINMKILVESLHSRGHEMVMIKQDHSRNIESQPFVTGFMKRVIEIRQSRDSLSGFLAFYQNLFKMIGENQQDVVNMVISIFENKTLIKELKGKK